MHKYNEIGVFKLNFPNKINGSQRGVKLNKVFNLSKVLIRLIFLAVYEWISPKKNGVVNNFLKSVDNSKKIKIVEQEWKSETLKKFTEAREILLFEAF